MTKTIYLVVKEVYYPNSVIANSVKSFGSRADAEYFIKMQEAEYNRLNGMLDACRNISLDAKEYALSADINNERSYEWLLESSRFPKEATAFYGSDEWRNDVTLTWHIEEVEHNE
jgi:hypothetical protein